MPKRTDKKQIAARSGSHNTIIFVIVILVFVVSNLLFWTVNTRVIKEALETETRMTISFLVDELALGSEESAGEVTEETSAQRLARLNQSAQEHLAALEGEKGEECEAWVTETGKELDPEIRSAINAYYRGTDQVGQDTVNTARPQEDTFWIGKGGRILLRGDCCAVRAIDDGLLVVVNHGITAKATQRRQFSRLVTIDLILLLIMIVLIVNNNARYRREIIRIATTDELTGLANRKYFNVEFAEFAESDRFQDSSLFLVDIDYFKQINDEYGHAAGDEALRSLGKELRKLMKKLDGFAGRWGGDEFIGIVPLPAEQLYEELSQLCSRVSEMPMEGGFTMTLSIGVTPTGNERNLARLTEKADQALYKSKEGGRNQVGLFTGEVLAATKPAVQSGVEKALAEADDFSLRDEYYEERLPGGEGERQPLGRRLIGYVRDKLIMSTILGVRWMAPFVAGGGILIALAFLFDAMSVDLSSLSVEERADLGSITAISAMLKEIGGATFNFMLPIFAAFMAYGIAGEGAFMAGFVGGYMTIDSNAGFVGAMIAGFAAGVITSEMQQFTRRAPAFVRNAAPIIIFPVFNLILMWILSVVIITPISSAIGSLFRSLLEAAVGYSHVLGGTLSGMMMAIDMGGIVNKVAYNYGTGVIASGGTDIMAAVMVGGMVPPIGIFLATVLFRKKFTEAERGRGAGTLFMGLSFITEGALPYVFTDVLRVIPSCMAGSAAAGFLSVLFGCTLPAPHGGIFVFPVMGHPLLYMIALAVGSMITAVLLGIWKKEVKEQERQK